MSGQERLSSRPLRLDAWLVRTVVPYGAIGTYVLYRAGQLIYAGRSDRNLQGRLMCHAYSGRAEYFSFDVHDEVSKAYDVECAHYHALQDRLVNLIHPARPAGHAASCLFCEFPEVLVDRVVANDVDDPWNQVAA